MGEYEETRTKERVQQLIREGWSVRETASTVTLTPPRKEIFFEDKDKFAAHLNFFFDWFSESKKNNATLEEWLRNNTKWRDLI